MLKNNSLFLPYQTYNFFNVLHKIYGLNFKSKLFLMHSTESLHILLTNNYHNIVFF